MRGKDSGRPLCFFALKRQSADRLAPDGSTQSKAFSFYDFNLSAVVDLNRITL